MNFHSVTTFFHMGGYADYVWPAYFLVAAILCAHFISARKKLKRQLKQRDQESKKSYER